jgi:hypothetical protein
MSDAPQGFPAGFADAATWTNPPPDWSFGAEGLVLATGDRTDFWRGTHYGFYRDSGHFLGAPVSGDLTAEIAFEGSYETLYDQAGLMLRRDAQTWLKAGIEVSDGVANASVVVTRGLSDWSTLALPALSGLQRLRLSRIGGAVILHFMNAGRAWQLLRVADLPEGGEWRLGPMACSPQRAGFRARFAGLRTGAPIASPLHEGQGAKTP